MTRSQSTTPAGESDRRRTRTIVLVREDHALGGHARHIPVTRLTGRDLRCAPEREKMFWELSLADVMMDKPFDLVGAIEKLLQGGKVNRPGPSAGRTSPPPCKQEDRGLDYCALAPGTP